MPRPGSEVPRPGGRLALASVPRLRERDGARVLDGGERSAAQVVPRVLAAQASRLDELVEEGRHLGALLRLAAVVVRPAHHHVAQLALDMVVVERHLRVSQEEG